VTDSWPDPLSGGMALIEQDYDYRGDLGGAFAKRNVAEVILSVASKLTLLMAKTARLRYLTLPVRFAAKPKGTKNKYHQRVRRTHESQVPAIVPFNINPHPFALADQGWAGRPVR